MVLKFHMQHDKAAGLQNDRIQAGWESIWPLLLKIAKPLKSTFPNEPLQIYVTFSQIDHQKLLSLPLLKIAKTQTLSHELPNGFCQNMCHTDARLSS